MFCVDFCCEIGFLNYILYLNEIRIGKLINYHLSFIFFFKRFDFLHIYFSYQREKSKKSIKIFRSSRPLFECSVVLNFLKMDGWNFFRMSKRNGELNNGTMDMNMPSSSNAHNTVNKNLLGQAGNSVIKRLGWKQG